MSADAVTNADGSAGRAGRVVVLGGGISGLAAARGLSATGHAVVVVERGHRPGGRATTDARDGFQIDSAHHLVSARDGNLLSLVRGAGLEGRMLPLRPVALAQVHEGALRPIEPTGTRGVRQLPGVRWREGLRVHRLGRLIRKFDDILTPDRPLGAVRMDDRSIADYVRTYFGQSVLERWVEPFVMADAGGAEVADASRQLFLLHQVGRAFAPTGTLRRGVGALADALAAPLDVRLENTALTVERAGAGFAVTVHGANGEERIEADTVVSALPARIALDVLAPVLVPAERDVLGSATTAPAIVAWVALDRALVRNATRVRVPAVEGLPAGVISLEPGGEGSVAPEGKMLVGIVARPDWSRAHLEAADEVVEKALVGVLGRLYPGAEAAIEFVTLRRHRDAYPRFEVGRYRALADLARVAADRRACGRALYHAGDHTHAPSLEGAAAAAHEVVARVEAGE